MKKRSSEERRWRKARAAAERLKRAYRQKEAHPVKYAWANLRFEWRAFVYTKLHGVRKGA